MQYASKHLVIICSLVLLLVPFFSVLQPTPAQAQTFNQQINYQGKLADNLGSTVADGSYSMVFRLYTVSTAGTHVWTETQDVTVTNGLFSVMLGSDTSLSGVDFNQTLYLGVNIEADGEMTPRKILGAVPAAFTAETANTANSVGGVASSSFLRSDQADTMEATSASTLLTINQQGGGNILDLLDNGTNVFTVTDGGGTSALVPQHQLLH